MRLGEFHQRPDGSELLVVHAAIASDFAPFLDPDIPVVTILGHRPRRTGGWWQATVPLSEPDQYVTARVRQMSFDLRLTTKEFLARIHDFDDQGLMLLQSRAPLPDSLQIDRLSDKVRTQVLVRNGITLMIQLPHAIETAVITSYQPGNHLARILNARPQLPGGSP